MTKKYTPNTLEVWLAHLYMKLGMYSSNQLCEKTIAQHFRIYLFKKEVKSFSYENGNYRSITLDKRMTTELQREAFFHELCHILRHAGWQTDIMPKAFKQLQEWDARRFVSYAAIPIHMLRNYNFNDPDIISVLSEDFAVTEPICKIRLERIMRVMYASN